MGPVLSPELKAEFTRETSPGKEKENENEKENEKEKGPDLRSECNLEGSTGKEEKSDNSSPEVKSEFTVAVSPMLEKPNGSVHQHHLHDNKLLSCASNYEDDTFDMEGCGEQIITCNGNGDMEVNVTDCINSDEIGLVEEQYQNDETESSSSFGNTDDDNDDGRGGSIRSDAETDLRFYHSNFPDGRGQVFRERKKKLTDHWRSYIRPLMWRCKWAELKMKEFQSQALKYDRELAIYDQRKLLELEKFNSEGLCAKSLPFPRKVQTNKIMKRKKRKRVEDTVDVASYMSHHILFSYYENKNFVAEGASLIDHGGNLGPASASKTSDNDLFGYSDGWSSLDFRYNDNSLEEILWKIDEAKLVVNKLKTRVDKVMSENAGKYSSINKLMLVPCNASTSSARNPTSPSNGNGTPVGSLYAAQHISDCNMGNLGMSETAASSDEEAMPVPDIIDSTEQHQAEEEVLIHNQAAKEELDNLHGVKLEPAEKPLVPKEEQHESTIPQVLVSEVDPSAITSIPHVQSTEKSPSTSKINVCTNKRNQGRRKGKSGRRKRKSTR